MSKEHHNSAHHEHAHAEHHEAKPKDEKILGFSMGTMALIVVLVLGTAIIATWAGYAIGAGSANGSGASNFGTVVSVDPVLVKSKVQNFVNDNFLSAADKNGGVSFVLGDANGFAGGMYEYAVFAVKGELKQQIGILYADDKQIVVAQGKSLELDKPLPKPEVSGGTTPVQTEPVKKDKAVAELYIFSYCPAGTAALDSFAKAADLLKNVADVKVKFFSNMHGDHELQQNKIQECIQVVNKDKYWAYAQQYVTKIYPVCGASRSVDCDKTESTKLMASLGIDSNAVFSCIATKGNELYASDTADAVALNLQYSPSVVINGVYNGNADRSPEGLKGLICGGFNTAPADCSKSLSATGATATGSCS
jgi:hypothetical protein